MIGAGWGVVSPIITRVSAKAIGGARSLVWGVATQSATYLAVDKVSDYILDESDDGYAESALDLILSIYLHNKGSKLFGKWKSSKGAGLNRKRREFLSSMGRTPWFDLRALKLAGVSFGRNYRRAFDIMYSSKKNKIVLSGKRSGRVYAIVSAEGSSIRGVNKLDGMSQFLLGAGAALSVEELTTVGLECLVDSIGAIVDHADVIDESDGDLVSDSFYSADDRLSFIRDPDVWLKHFGDENTPAGVLIDRAMKWFISNDADIGVTQVIDTELNDVELQINGDESLINIHTGLPHVRGTGGILYDKELGKIVIDNGAEQDAETSVLDGRAVAFLLDIIDGFSSDEFFGDIAGAIGLDRASEQRSDTQLDKSEISPSNKEQQSRSLSTL